MEFTDAIRNFVPRYFRNDGVVLECMSVLFILAILAVIYCDINRGSESYIQRVVHRDIFF